GKTSLIRRFVEDVFDDRHVVTLGAKVTKKELDVKMPDSGDPMRAILGIWDILGQWGLAQFLKDSYFRGAQGLLAVCDVTRPLTLARLEGWRQAATKVAGQIPTYVVANKADLVEDQQFGEDKVRAFCTRWGSPYLLTSAKTGEGVEEAFRRLTGLILRAQFRKMKGFFGG
ncbi:MAG: Rab family GTPase, partial [Thermoplasmata archaeon]